jgi:hypothetical protein
MSNVIRAVDVQRASVGQVKSEINDLSSEVKNVESFIGQIQKLAETVKGAIDKVSELRQGREMAAKAMSGLPANSPSVKPTTPPPRTTPPPPQEEKPMNEPIPEPTPTPEPRITPTLVPIDREKVATLLYQLIKEQATKLPDNVKAMTIDTVIGEKFDEIKITTMGMTIDAPTIIGVVTAQLCDHIEAIQRDTLTTPKK